MSPRAQCDIFKLFLLDQQSQSARQPKDSVFVVTCFCLLINLVDAVIKIVVY